MEQGTCRIRIFNSYTESTAVNNKIKPTFSPRFGARPERQSRHSLAHYPDKNCRRPWIRATACRAGGALRRCGVGPHRAPARLHVLERLAPAQAAEPIGVGAHVAHDLVRVGPRVLAQRPADRLAQEELVARERRFDARVQEGEVGVCLEADLTEDRAARASTCRRRAPSAATCASSARDARAATHRCRCVAMPSTRSHHAPVVDHLFEDRQRCERAVLAIRARAGQLERGVALLAMGSAAEQAEHGVAPCREARQRMACEHLLARRAHRHRGARRGTASRSSCTPASRARACDPRHAASVVRMSAISARAAACMRASVPCFRARSQRRVGRPRRAEREAVL